MAGAVPREYDGRSAKELTLAGYFVVSNRYCAVARVDVGEEELVTWALRTFGEAALDRYGRVTASIRDHYRRCHSKDVMTVRAEMIRNIPNSSSESGTS